MTAAAIKAQGFGLRKVLSNSMNIFNNRAFDNYSGYGLYIYNTGAKIKNNEFFRNSLGGIMIVGASKGSATNITIKNSLIQTNGEHGVCIMDFNQGHIQIANCKINENYRDGINLLQTREILVEKSFKHKIENFISDDAVVKLKACEINNNGFYGINIVKFKCVIEKL
jgi:Protein of unknown function (DUF1565).